MSRRCTGSYPTAIRACQIALAKNVKVQVDFQDITPIEKDFAFARCVKLFGTLRRGSGCTDSQALLKEVIPLVVTRRTVAEFTQSAA